MNQSIPKSLRLQIGIFGRTNVGKSSFLNTITSQDVSIVSPLPGTTTDVVEKVMEFRPAGPVVFLDTAGIDDKSQLSSDRIQRTSALFDRADVFVVITENEIWGEYEESIREKAESKKASLIVIVNKSDVHPLSDNFRDELLSITPNVMSCSCTVSSSGETVISAFRELLTACVPEEFLSPQAIVNDLIPKNGLAVLVVPVDAGAPKGRLIMPQVQTIRDILDGDSTVVVVKESQYSSALSMLNGKPDIVICDSQVVQNVAEQTPVDVPCTTFSVLFARLKGDLEEAARGALSISKLKAGDKVLIAEACTHHAAEDDIGRVKIPRWLKEYTGIDLQIDTCCGRDYPENLEQYALIIHCGACTLTRREMLGRSIKAVEKNVPITNYGLAISCFKGVLNRVIEPFKNNNYK
ncbi:MAG: [FeFe] hydrogenase H-cluster maturation GTPase HydF [Chitinispirillia bacterium]|nr:[FeFe] hydrogenase H-cluster maturation GTPase HydF [Chitinispirillia bacterium]